MCQMLVPTAHMTSEGVTLWTFNCLVRWLCVWQLAFVCVPVYFSGAPLWQILAAGEWRSPAFMEHLDKYQLEPDVVVQAHVGESDDEDAV